MKFDNMQPNQQELKSYYREHETERLRFRLFGDADIERWMPFFADTETLNHVGMLSGKFKNMTNSERAAAWISRQMERRVQGTLGQLAVIEKSSGKFIGVGGIILREEPEAKGEWEVAYSLLHEARGNGYATELAVYFKEWAFANTRVESVISFVHIKNEASQNLTRKNGMHIEKEMTFFEMPTRLNRVFKK